VKDAASKALLEIAIVPELLPRLERWVDDCITVAFWRKGDTLPLSDENPNEPQTGPPGNHNGFPGRCPPSAPPPVTPLP
jgi:hypothetical protein